MLWCISFFNYADRQALASVFPLLQEEMHLSHADLGLLGSAFAWCYGLSAPLAGIVVDRVRRKTAILGGLQTWSLICVATGLARRFNQLIFFRAAEGLGETFYYPASTTLISDYHGPATRSRALGIHQTSVYVGSIAGGVFAGLIGQFYGWRWSFVVFGGLGMLLGLVLTRFLHEPPRGATDRVSALKIGTDSLPSPSPPTPLPLSTGGEGSFAQASGWSAIMTPAVVLLMLAFVCANGVAIVLLTWMPTFLKEQFDLSLAMAGLTATVFVQLASMVGSLLGGWLADRWQCSTSAGRILVQIVGVLGGAPFVFLCGQTQAVGGLMVILTAWGLFKGLYDANIFAAVFDVVPAESRGRAAGLMNMAGWLGGGSASVLVGVVADRYGLGPAIGSTAFIYLLAAVLLLAATRWLPRGHITASTF